MTTEEPVDQGDETASLGPTTHDRGGAPDTSYAGGTIDIGSFEAVSREENERALLGLAPLPQTVEEYQALVNTQLELRNQTESFRESQRRYQETAYMGGQRVTHIEAYLRAALAVVLVLGTLFIVGYGVALGVPAGDLAQYIAPLTGLAGLAVGYFFGRTTEDRR